jgi:hypothetical protein
MSTAAIRKKELEIQPRKIPPSDRRDQRNRRGSKDRLSNPRAEVVTARVRRHQCIVVHSLSTQT